MAHSPSSFIFLIALFSLAMVSSITEARPAPAGENKDLQGVDKNVHMVEAIENPMHGGSTSSSGESNIKDCHINTINNPNSNRVYGRDFESRPSAWVHRDDPKLKGYETTFNKDFEPRPSASAYRDDTKLEGYERIFKKDFEPRPSASAYRDDTKLQSYETIFKIDFEPKPSVIAYPNKDVGTKIDSLNDFEPRPNLSVYHN